MSDIDVRETIEDKKSWFNVKRFKIDKITFEKPEKSIDSKLISKNKSESVKDLYFTETTKQVNNFEQIEAIHKASDKKTADEFFNKKEWMEKPHVINLTFGFKPSDYLDKEAGKNAFTGFLDYYYTYSTLLTSVPNLKISKFNPQTKKKEIKVNVEEYTKFTDFSYQILKTKNNKPIFLPISLKFSQQDLLKILEHYVKEEQFYYWIDFEGRPINSYTLGQLRFLMGRIKALGFYDRSITYFTNVNREILANPMDQNSPASDVLCALGGANIIGVNRSPQRIINSKGGNPTIIQIRQSQENKLRLLNIESYYYVKQNALSINMKDCVIQNEINLEKEFGEQSKNLLETGDVDKFLHKKEMLNKYKNGDILKAIESKESKNIKKWY